MVSMERSYGLVEGVFEPEKGSYAAREVIAIVREKVVSD